MTSAEEKAPWTDSGAFFDRMNGNAADGMEQPFAAAVVEFV
jgi:hypothetical protein